MEQHYERFGDRDEIKDDLEQEGISPLLITLAKGRDGMRRGTWPGEFHFRQSRITEGIAERPASGPLLLPRRAQQREMEASTSAGQRVGTPSVNVDVDR